MPLAHSLDSAPSSLATVPNGFQKTFTRTHIYINTNDSRSIILAWHLRTPSHGVLHTPSTLHFPWPLKAWASPLLFISYQDLILYPRPSSPSAICSTSFDTSSASHSSGGEARLWAPTGAEGPRDHPQPVTAHCRWTPSSSLSHQALGGG